MVIRRAGEDDVDGLVLLAADMVAEAPAWDLFDPDEMRHTLGIILNGAGAAFVSELPDRDRFCGAAVAFLTNRPFSGELFVADLALYVAPEHRGSVMARDLIAVLEAWAREEGAVEIQLGISSGIHPKKTGRLYEALGYGQSGLVYSKRLGSTS